MNDDAMLDHADAAQKALEEGDLHRARAELEKARALGPDAPEVVLLDVEIALEEASSEEDLEKAVEILEAACERDPDDAVLAAHLGAYLIEALEDHAGALPHLERATKHLEEFHLEDADAEAADEHRSFLVDVLVLLSEARAVCLDPKGALAAADRAMELDDLWPEAHLAVGGGRFDLCDLAGARTAVAEALRLEPSLADAHWLLGRIETVEGNEKAAEAAFRAAARHGDEGYHLPTRITEDEMVKLVERAVDELPERVRTYMENVAIVVEDVPSVERLLETDPPLSPGSLGMFEGTPPSQETTMDSWTHYPKQITLYRKNLEVEASSEDDLAELVTTTVLHEIGHFLGLDEDDLYDRGLA